MIKTTLVTLAAFAALGLANAQDARADESSFVNKVAAHDVPVNDKLLAVGYEICTMAATDGAAGIDAEAQTALEVGISSHDSAVIIVTAIYELCPSNKPALNVWLHS